MLKSTLLLSALVAGGCTPSSSPVAPSAMPAAAAGPSNQPTIRLFLEPHTSAVRLRAVGLREATEIDLLLDWHGEVYYDGFSPGLWWFVDAFHWQYVFTLDRSHRRMSFHVWRGQPIDGDGLLGVIRFRNNGHLPLRGANVWVDGVEVRTVVTAGGDPERNGGLAPTSPATREGR